MPTTRRYRRRPPKRFVRPRIPRGMTTYRMRKKFNQPIYRFRRINENWNLPSSNSVVSSGALTFQLDDLPNYTEFTALFDQYRIKGIKVQFFFQTQPADISASSFAGIFYTCIDLDDNTPPATESVICERGTTKVHRPFGTLTRFIRPRTAQAMYKGAFTGYGQGQANWLDCSNPDIEYYGLKYLWTITGTDNLMCHVSTVYYLEFRSSR